MLQMMHVNQMQVLSDCMKSQNDSSKQTFRYTTQGSKCERVSINELIAFPISAADRTSESNTSYTTVWNLLQVLPEPKIEENIKLRKCEKIQQTSQSYISNGQVSGNLKYYIFN